MNAEFEVPIYLLALTVLVLIGDDFDSPLTCGLCIVFLTCAGGIVKFGGPWRDSGRSTNNKAVLPRPVSSDTPVRNDLGVLCCSRGVHRGLTFRESLEPGWSASGMSCAVREGCDLRSVLDRILFRITRWQPSPASRKNLFSILSTERGLVR